MQCTARKEKTVRETRRLCERYGSPETLAVTTVGKSCNEIWKKILKEVTNLWATEHDKGFPDARYSSTKVKWLEQKENKEVKKEEMRAEVWHLIWICSAGSYTSLRAWIKPIQCTAEVSFRRPEVSALNVPWNVESHRGWNGTITPRHGDIGSLLTLHRLYIIINAAPRK